MILKSSMLLLLCFIDFLTAFFEITQWSVGRPVPPIRPEKNTQEKAVAMFEDVVTNCTEDF